MKTRFICYALALLLASPAFATAEATPVTENARTEISTTTSVAKNKKPKKVKKGKKPKRKNVYRPGARQN